MIIPTNIQSSKSLMHYAAINILKEKRLYQKMQKSNSLFERYW